MDDYIREIHDSIKKLSSPNGDGRVYIPVKTFDATVQSVNKKKRTCVVNSEKENLEGLTVRLSPEVCDGDINIPQVGSTVTVMSSGITDPYIVSTTWIDGKIIIIGNQGYENDGVKQVFNDGSYGGLVKVQEATDNFNSIEQYVLALNNAVQAAITSIDGTAGSTGTATFNSLMAGQQINLKNMENKSITHGKKL